ncbi:AmmeMemoRadiSam system protein B [Thiohalorhabdus methylotrophus]|uniref:MEMO1 family protein ACERLL_09965 n=1 Tax=Thiohalorhabdus methylotrophus TaxID=3242694 RepID=A0ABV4TVK9_9GAMM
MPDVRDPAIAGTFYPAEPEQLRKQVDDLVAGNPDPAARPAAPKGLIVPHAGYMYSGPVAATAYARLAPARDRIRRVVLLGPSHHVPFRGLAASSADAFRTPLGRIPLDTEGVRAALRQSGVQTLDAAHGREHSLEAQLPFLQRMLADFSLLPLVVGAAEPGQVGRVLEALWGGPETLIVISSDLSHFLDYATAGTLDATTARAIEALDGAGITHEHACGYQPVRGLLRIAARRRSRLQTLDLRSSGDAGAPLDRVVGYGAFALEESGA